MFALLSQFAPLIQYLIWLQFHVNAKIKIKALLKMNVEIRQIKIAQKDQYLILNYWNANVKKDFTYKLRLIHAKRYQIVQKELLSMLN